MVKVLVEVLVKGSLCDAYTMKRESQIMQLYWTTLRTITVKCMCVGAGRRKKGTCKEGMGVGGAEREGGLGAIGPPLFLMELFSV